MTPTDQEPQVSPRRFGLAVLIAALSVGCFAILYTITPHAEAEPQHLSGLCEAILDQEIAHYTQAAYGGWRTTIVPDNQTDGEWLAQRAAAYVDNPTGATDSFYAGEAARRLYALEEC